MGYALSVLYQRLSISLAVDVSISKGRARQPGARQRWERQGDRFLAEPSHL